jgi:adenylate kinase family enzyme
LFVVQLYHIFLLFLSLGPGAGKGTQSQLLSIRHGTNITSHIDEILPSHIQLPQKIIYTNHYSFTCIHISIGSLLRVAIQPQNIKSKNRANIKMKNKKYKCSNNDTN